MVNETAAQIEFLTMTEMTSRIGKVVTISELQNDPESILESNNAENPRGGRKALRQLLLREIPEIEFNAPKRVNESERVSIKKARDQAIQMAGGSDHKHRLRYENSVSFYRWIIQGPRKMSFLLKGNLRKCTIVQLFYPRPLYRCV